MATINPMDGTSIPFNSATTFTINWNITPVPGNPFNDKEKIGLADSQGSFIEGCYEERVISGNPTTLVIKPSDYGKPPNAYYLRFDGRTIYGSDADSSIFDSLWDATNPHGKLYPLIMTEVVGAPSSPTLSATISRDAEELSWGAGSAGTNNSVTGYDVQYCDSADGNTWSEWADVYGSPVTATKIVVAPPPTIGHYRLFRVRTRGSAGESYYSNWVWSTTALRRKWNAFGAWTDPTLTPRVSMIRAVHLTEMQTRVNTIRTFHGMAANSFTAVTARVTKIAKWASLIQEIRDAVDGITTDHEGWNTLEAGKPKIANITQLRNIIDNL